MNDKTKTNNYIVVSHIERTIQQVIDVIYKVKSTKEYKAIRQSLKYGQSAVHYTTIPESHTHMIKDYNAA